MTVLFLIVLSVFSCKGNKGGLDNQESDTVMVAKDSIPFVLKHLDVDKKKVMAYVLTSSSCHPKIFVKEFSYFLMSYHQHCLGVNLLVQR